LSASLPEFDSVLLSGHLIPEVGQTPLLVIIIPLSLI
jgi:hypothetical protein